METEIQGEIPAEAAPVVETEPVAESAPATVEPSEPPKKDRLQERFDTLTREKYDALRERDRLQWEVEELRRSREAAKTPPVAPEQPLTLEQFGYDEAKFNAAVAERAAKIAEQRATEVVDQELRKREERQRAEKRERSWSQREAEFAAKQSDYREAVYTEETRISPAMAEALKESDMGPAIAYYLGKNRAEAAEIAEMSPLAAARAIGKIEAKLEAKPVPPPVSKAPPPPPKIEAADATVSVSPDSPESDSLSDAEWMRKREKQLARRKA